MSRYCGAEFPWTPTHRVPDAGLPAWAAPDPSLPPVVTLAGRLDLVAAERAGDWARVEADNGRTGWVDARLLVDTPGPQVKFPGEDETGYLVPCAGYDHRS